MCIKNNVHIGYIKDQGSYIIIVDEQAGHVVNLYIRYISNEKRNKKTSLLPFSFPNFLKTKQCLYVYSCELCHVTCLRPRMRYDSERAWPENCKNSNCYRYLVIVKIKVNSTSARSNVISGLSAIWKLTTLHKISRGVNFLRNYMTPPFFLA